MKIYWHWYRNDDKWSWQSSLRHHSIWMGTDLGWGELWPPLVGKLCTLQPFSWPGSQDKVRIVCQWVAMPRILSAVCKCLSHFCFPGSSFHLSWHPVPPGLWSQSSFRFCVPSCKLSQLLTLNIPTYPSLFQTERGRSILCSCLFSGCFICMPWHHFLSHEEPGMSDDSHRLSVKCQFESNTCGSPHVELSKWNVYKKRKKGKIIGK